MPLKKIAINGFGRIGRCLAKINIKYSLFDLVLINDTTPSVDSLAYLFQYDSTYGRFAGNVFAKNNDLIINNKNIKCTSFSNISDLLKNNSNFDLIIDSSGVSNNVALVKKFLNKKKKIKYLVTQSSDEADNEIILGVNEDSLLGNQNIISSSICDANAVSHFIKMINDEYGIKNGSLTTLHPWLSYQNLVDGPSLSISKPNFIWPDYSLGRASSSNLIPKNTTAMTVLEKVIPEIKNKFISFSFRIPTDVVAAADLTILTNKKINNKDFTEFLNNKCKNSKYISQNFKSLVSSDYKQTEYSGILDMQWVKTKNELIKLVIWYDNEWAYSCRVLDLAKKMLN